MKQLVKVVVADEELTAEVRDGEVTGYRPVNIAHLNKDILGCVTFIVMIGNAITRTKEVK